MAQTPEGRVKGKIKKVLKKHGAYFFMPVQSGYGATALDFFICHHGKFIAVEAKRVGVNNMTSLQDTTAENIEDAGGIVLLVNGDGMLARLDNILGEMTNARKRKEAKKKRKKAR